MFTTLQRWLQVLDTGRRPHHTTARPELETLEGREVPAGVGLNQGVLMIVGTPGADAALVSASSSIVLVKMNVAGSASTSFHSFARSAVKQVVFDLLDGPDIAWNRTALPCRAFGGGGDDVLIG